MSKVFRKKRLRCECADRGCPVHKPHGACARRAMCNMRRVDTDDVGGVNFCAGCAEVASNLGVFGEERRAQRR